MCKLSVKYRNQSESVGKNTKQVENVYGKILVVVHLVSDSGLLGKAFYCSCAKLKKGEHFKASK